MAAALLLFAGSTPVYQGGREKKAPYLVGPVRVRGRCYRRSQASAAISKKYWAFLRYRTRDEDDKEEKIEKGSVYKCGGRVLLLLLLFEVGVLARGDETGVCENERKGVDEC